MAVTLFALIAGDVSFFIKGTVLLKTAMQISTNISAFSQESYFDVEQK
jgi:hypothetical protein